MIHNEYEIAMTKQKVLVRETAVCDLCNETIYVHPRGLVSNYPVNTVSYFLVTTGHNDWGNDSVDSVETIHVCDNCIRTVFDKYCDRAFEDVNNTQYINIEHRSTFTDEGAYA